MKKVLSYFIAFFFVIASLGCYGHPSGENYDREGMRSYALEVARAFQEMYAPGEWKAKNFGWSLVEERDKLLTKIDNGLTVPEFHQALSQFFASTRDYHVSVYFAGTGYSYLPFTLAYADGAYYISSIDRLRLPVDRFPFWEGNQITAFNDEPIADIVARLKAGKPSNRELTDYGLLALSVTNRRSALADPLERGPVTVTGFDSQGNTVASQTVWIYEKEEMEYPTVVAPVIKERKATAQELIQELKQKLNRRYLLPQFAKMQSMESHSQTAAVIGDYRGTLDILGTKIIWQSEPDSEFFSYIYQNEHRQNIGVLRIPSFMAYGRHSNFDAAVADFANAIEAMNSYADLLIIDQMNNPGGSLFYLYALASYLTNKPLVTPREKMALNASMINDAHQSIRMIKQLELAGGIGDGASFSIDGYIADNQFIYFMKDYFQFIVDQWNSGKTLTDPYFVYGVDHIAPRVHQAFTKPILLLTNRFDFSCGDFFPAIMQDNQRVVIMGENTAGAGGYVLGSASTNRLGVEGFSFTGSIGIRPSGLPIENLGVTPDIPYIFGRQDMESGYRFANAVERQVQLMLLNTSRS